ncbi:MAG: caspase family protein [bacterium]|nr:caspase family protein [bacterium]
MNREPSCGQPRATLPDAWRRKVGAIALSIGTLTAGSLTGCATTHQLMSGPRQADGGRPAYRVSVLPSRQGVKVVAQPEARVAAARDEGGFFSNPQVVAAIDGLLAFNAALAVGSFSSDGSAYATAGIFSVGFWAFDRLVAWVLEGPPAVVQRPEPWDVALIDPGTGKPWASRDFVQAGDDRVATLEWPSLKAGRSLRVVARGMLPGHRWVELHTEDFGPARLASLTRSGQLPRLAATVTFTDPGQEKALVAEQGGELVIEVENTGKGPASDVGVQVSGPALPDLTYPARVSVASIPVGEKRTVRVPLMAGMRLPDGKATLRVEVAEDGGVDAAPVEVALVTRKRRLPELVVEQSGVMDENDGVLRRGEQLTLTLAVRNRGLVRAEHVRAELASLPAQVLPVEGADGIDLGAIEPGGVALATCSLLVNNRYAGPVPVPVSFTLSERRPEVTTSAKVAIALDGAATVVSTAVAARAVDRPEMVLAPELSVDVDQPLKGTAPEDPDAVALVVGVERFVGKIPGVPFAERDAGIVREYLVKALGVPAENVVYLTNDRASQGAIRTALEGQLPGMVTPGKSRVFVYFAGHGAPDPEAKTPYVVPYDGNPDYTGTSCVKLADVYRALGNLKAREVTVMLDACFSGESGRQAAPVSLLAQARPIFIRPQAAEVPPGVRVLAAATGDQVSLGYPEKQHGLFTYFLLKALREAHEAGKAPDWPAMQVAVAERVSKQARRQGRTQTPVWLDGGAARN